MHHNTLVGSILNSLATSSDSCDIKFPFSHLRGSVISSILLLQEYYCCVENIGATHTSRNLCCESFIKIDLSFEFWCVILNAYYFLYYLSHVYPPDVYRYALPIYKGSAFLLFKKLCFLLIKLFIVRKSTV